jgi:hypothetical protein
MHRVLSQQIMAPTLMLDFFQIPCGQHDNYAINPKYIDHIPWYQHIVVIRDGFILLLQG